MCPINAECYYCKSEQHDKCDGWADAGGCFGTMVPCSCADTSRRYEGLESGGYKLPAHPNAGAPLLDLFR